MLRGSWALQGTEPELATCKANALLFVLFDPSSYFKFPTIPDPVLTLMCLNSIFVPSLIFETP